MLKLDFVKEMLMSFLSQHLPLESKSTFPSMGNCLLTANLVIRLYLFKHFSVLEGITRHLFILLVSVTGITHPLLAVPGRGPHPSLSAAGVVLVPCSCILKRVHLLNFYNLGCSNSDLSFFDFHGK